MKLTTRTHYGIRAMLELAENHGHGPLQIKVIANRQDISVKYLEQLMATLKSGGLIRSIRGSKGGYTLTRVPADVKLSEIFNCLEGPVVTIECVEDENYCARAANCAIRQVWVQVRDAMMNVLQSMTLQDLVNRAKERKNLDYQI